MTPEETRQLGIEFERRVQTMIPETEYTDKLDTDTIYSFLNQYQDKYVHDIYRSLDQIPSGTKLSAHVEAVLQAMLREVTVTTDPSESIIATSSIEDPNGITISDTGRSVIYKLPETFYMYVRSVSSVSTTFSFKSASTENNTAIRVLPNELVSQSEVWKLIETPHNTLRILRHPAAVLSQKQKFPVTTTIQEQANTDAPEVSPVLLLANDTPVDSDPIGQQDPIGDVVGPTTQPTYKEFPTLTVVYDQYTTPLGIKVLYYAEPKHFNIMTSTSCELPMDVFEDLVSGAVDLYVLYVAGAEARKRLIDEARRQQLKKLDDKNED